MSKWGKDKTPNPHGGAGFDPSQQAFSPQSAQPPSAYPGTPSTYFPQYGGTSDSEPYRRLFNYVLIPRQVNTAAVSSKATAVLRPNPRQVTEHSRWDTTDHQAPVATAAVSSPLPSNGPSRPLIRTLTGTRATKARQIGCLVTNTRSGLLNFGRNGTRWGSRTRCS